MLAKIATALVLGFCFCAARGESPPQPDEAPVEAEFLKPLNIRNLSAGATLFARVTRDWNGPGCFLRQGSMLQATVELADIRGGFGASKLALAFTGAQCGPGITPLYLRLFAVAALPHAWQNLPNALYQAAISFPALDAISARTEHNAVSRFPAHLALQALLHHFPSSATARPGDVIGIPGLRLNAASPDRLPVLSARGQQLALEAHTQLLLAPSSPPFASAHLPPHAAHDPAERIALRHPVAFPARGAKDFDVCEPPGCAHDVAIANRELAGQSAGSIAIQPLGYSPRTSMYLDDFVNDDTLAWLGPRQLLFTFNAHPLIPREGVPNSRAVHRMVRAVLIDPQQRTVIRAVDWEIMDSNRYLWPLAGNRVLVHVGNELRVYGAGLQVERTVPLAAPLAFLRMTPNGELITVATLRERHSPALHAALRDEFGEVPGEDLHVEVLDRRFRMIAQASTISEIEPPALLNEGQLMLLPQSGHHYQLALNAWDGKRADFGRFASGCTPQLSSTAPNLTLLLTCNTLTSLAEYRVLRADGKLLIHGAASAREVGPEIAGDPSNGMFVIKTVHSLRTLLGGMYFRGVDLESNELRVYRASDGKQLLAVRVSNPATSRGGYALSPDGAQLAVLSTTGIQLFPVTTK